MPTPFGAAAIVLFWLVTSSLVVYRDIWPRYSASGPPPISIDLADEAGQFVPVRWLLKHNEKKVGSLTTEMKYIGFDDTFRFTHTYRELAIDVAGVRVAIPELIETTRVTRTGDLRAQTLDGRINASLGPGALKVLEFAATARIRAKVVEGQLLGHVELSGPGRTQLFERDLEPVPVPEGHVLNPLLPVNRLARVRPGLRWVVPEVNPLRDAVAVMGKEYGLSWPNAREELVAEVASEPQNLEYKGEEHACWIIEYRTTVPKARTWVKTTAGKVLRQEAFEGGERISLDRDD